MIAFPCAQEDIRASAYREAASESHARDDQFVDTIGIGDITAKRVEPHLDIKFRADRLILNDPDAPAEQRRIGAEDWISIPDIR